MIEPVQRLRDNANKCRDLASTATSPDARDVLNGLADQYERRVVYLVDSGAARPHQRPAFVWPLR